MGVTPMEMPNARTDTLMQDLKTVVRDTEDLLKATAGDVSEQAVKARTRATESLRNARTRLTEAQQDLMARARASARAADEYVHENPWPTIGVAAGVGFVFGLLIGRR
jgi:ElaB/YqjD/DUF883 family membrane-anchored ribosome-binding protein